MSQLKWCASMLFNIEELRYSEITVMVTLLQVLCSEKVYTASIPTFSQMVNAFNAIILFLQGQQKTYLMACIIVYITGLLCTSCTASGNCCMGLRMSIYFDCLLQPPTALTATFVLLEAWSPLRGEWRCVWKEGGVVCVGQVGTTRMRLLCADSWATLQQVQVSKSESCC